MTTHTLSIAANSTAKYDVVVAGGGPAGIGAAAAAAKNNCRVLLIESTGCLGGTASNCGLPLWLGNPPDELLPDDGLYIDFVNMLKSISPGTREIAPPLNKLPLKNSIVYDPEKGKMKFEEFVLGYDVELLYFTTLLAVRREHNRVTGVFISNKDGVTYVEADAFVDCTGDADMAHSGGFATFRETPCAPVSLLWQVEDVDKAELEEYLDSGGDHRFREMIKALRDKKIWNWPDNILGFFPTHRTGMMIVNPGMAQVNVDGTSAKELTEVMVRGRKAVYDMLEKVMRPFVPGFKNASVRYIAAAPGIRETRKIKGLYTLTYEDILARTAFPDTVVISHYGFDLGRPEQMPDGSWRSEQPLRDNRKVPGGQTCLPYRCLVPESSENMLVAGRCVSVAEQALGPVRVMLPCFAAGLAAGAAAVQIAGDGINAAEVNIEKLRQDAGLQYKIL